MPRGKAKGDYSDRLIKNRLQGTKNYNSALLTFAIWLITISSYEGCQTGWSG